MKWIKKVTSTPLTVIAKVIDSLQAQTNDRQNAPSIRAVREGIESITGSMPRVVDSLDESAGDKTNAPSIHATRSALTTVSNGVIMNGAKIGALSELHTVTKSNLVAAVNELSDEIYPATITVKNQAGETYSALLVRLYSLVNFEKLTANTTLKYIENTGAEKPEILRITRWSALFPETIMFSNVRYKTAGEVVSINVTMQSAGGAFTKLNGTTTTNLSQTAIAVAEKVSLTFTY